MRKNKKMEDTNKETLGEQSPPEVESAYEVIKVLPGIVYWGTKLIPWQNWDLRRMSEAQKKMLHDAGFEYLREKKQTS